MKRLPTSLSAMPVPCLISRVDAEAAVGAKMAAGAAAEVVVQAEVAANAEAATAVAAAEPQRTHPL